jgi:hypothetical protein
MKAMSTRRISARERASSAKTALPSAPETASAAVRSTAFGRRPLELGGDPAADDLEHRLGERDVGKRGAVHDGEQAEAIAVAIAQEERRVRVHALGREQAARLELAARPLTTWRNSLPTTCSHGVPAIAYSNGGAALPSSRLAACAPRLRLVGEDGDETGRGAEAVGHLANEVVEERRARRPRCRQGDPMQRLRVSLPGAGLGGGRGHEPV